MSLLLALLGGVTNVTATLAVTEGADTASFAASETLTATFAVTEGADVVSVVASEIFTATLSVTEGADTATFAASETLTATLDVTEGADVAAFAGDVIAAGVTADLAVTEGADVFAAIGIVPEQAVGTGGVGVRPPNLRDEYYSAIPLLKRKIRKEQEEEEARQIAAAAQQVVADIAAELERKREPLDYSKAATPTTDLAAYAKARTEAQAKQAELQQQDDEDAIIAILMAA